MRVNREQSGIPKISHRVQRNIRSSVYVQWSRKWVSFLMSDLTLP